MNLNINRRAVIFTLLFSILTISSVHAQYTRKNDELIFRNAIELFNKGLYTAASEEFGRYINGSAQGDARYSSDAAAYQTLCSIELKRGNTEGVVREFFEKYPESKMAGRIYLRYASYFFDKKDYLKAYELLSKVDKRELPSADILDYSFKSGYCNLRVGHIEKALADFSEIIYRPASAYTAPSQYYTAYIYYIKRDFKQAIERFKPLVKDKRFAVLSRYYLLESNFMLQNYKYVIDNGEDLYNIVDKEYKAKTARMMSESYFALKRTDEAKFYFEKYSLYSGELSRKDIYYSGIIAYTLKNYVLATESFQKLLGIDDTLAQNARYHIANCYLQLKNKQRALDAFRAASESKFDSAIREDAFFNYAKLSFDIYSDITQFDRYRKEFTPSEAKANEIQTYIATSFILKQDYKAAVEALNQIKNGGDVQNRLLQRASFLRGLQLAELGAFREASPYFETGANLAKYNEFIGNMSKFWLAESLYRNNQFADAITSYEQLAGSGGRFRNTTEFRSINFNLGYAYLKAGNYELAEKSFDSYMKSGDRLYYDEAAARLGDSYFLQKRYLEAADSYAKAGSENPKIYFYAVLQRAISLGLKGDDAQKISILKYAVQMNPESEHYSELQYELGRTYVQTGDNTGASACFADIAANHKSSPFYPKSLLELGMISVNKHDVNSAIEYYKRVITEFPSSPEAQDALSGLENVYQESDRSDEFLAFLDKTGLSSVKSATEKELMLYNTGERQFLNSNYTSAINTLKRYIAEYPQGNRSANAYYYLGESYGKLNKLEDALDSYRKVMEYGDGSFTELATLNFARISFKLENYKQAYLAYESLENVAKIENNITEAKFGKVNSLFMDKQYKEAVNEASSINMNSLDDFRKERIKFVVAKSRFMTGERAQAIPALKEISKNYASDEGAESHYLIILNAFESGNFKDVEKLVFAFSDTKTPQKYWLAKSYMILGDSYSERDDIEQAKATFTSILESYKPSGGNDDIAEQIRTRLNNLKKK